MKKLMAVIFLLTFLSKSAFAADPGNGTYHITIADKRFPVIFEDGRYSHKLKNIIVQDMQKVYAQFESYELLPRNTPIGFDKYMYQGREINANYMIHLAGNKNYSVIPDAFWRKPLGHLTEIDGEYHFMIPGVIVKDYIKAIKFREEHADVFKKLEPFFISFNKLNTATDLTDSELRNLFYNVNAPENEIHDEKLREYANELSQYRTAYFSLLHKCESRQHNETLQKFFPSDKEVMVCEIPFIERKSGKAYSTNDIPIANVDSQWKILLVLISG